MALSRFVLLDLAGTKASVIQVRAEAKDYLDLDALMRLGKMDLATALAAAHALYGLTFNLEVTLKALSYFDDGNLRDLPDDLRLLPARLGPIWRKCGVRRARIANGERNEGKRAHCR